MKKRIMTSIAFVLLANTASASFLTPPSWFPRAAPTSTPAATALRDALVAGETSSAVLRPLVDECVAARVKFQPKLLGDGALWRASAIVTGETPRWEKQAKLLPFLKNRAGQQYALSGNGGTVLNYGEVIGRALYFKAEGTFQPASVDTSRCPVDFDVAVERGGICVADGRYAFLSDAISGPGFLRVLYIDQDVRIFESPTDSPDVWEKSGLVVVQVRDTCFDDPVEGAL